MKLTRSTGYAISSLVYMVQEGNFAPVPARDIAHRYQIPLDYLLKVLKQLVAGGILLSFRGPSGGFKLARKPQEVTLLQIIEAVEGPLRANIKELPERINPAVAERLLRTFQNLTRQSSDFLSQVSLDQIMTAPEPQGLSQGHL